MDVFLVSIATASVAPILAFVGKLTLERRDPGDFRSLRRHAELRNALPEGSRDKFDEMLTQESDRYASNRLQKLTRKLHGPSLAALIFVGVLTIGVGTPLVMWALVFWPAWIAVGLVALFGGALMIVGSGQLYRYPDL